MTITDIDAYETPEQTEARIRTIAREGIGRFSATHRRKDGSTYPVEIRAITIRLDHPPKFAVFFREHSATTAVEPYASESDHTHYLERELYDLVRTDPRIFDFLQAGSLDGIWYWDLERPDNEWMSPRFWDLLGFDPAEKSHNPEEWQALIDPDGLNTALENFHNHLADPDCPYNQVVRYTHKDGSDVWVRCRGLAIRDAAGKPIRMLGAHNDLTALVKSTENLKLLLKEMNHRVKNNLAIVQSLIALKQREIGDSTDLGDIERQIETIRIVHEELQDSDSVGFVSIEDHLSRIVRGIFTSSQSGAAAVRISTDGGSISTTIAVPVGLIVNELATNAIKHSLTGTEKDSFTIDARRIEGEHLHELIISNNGAPFPAQINIDDPKTLGLRIVSALVSQLHGTMELTRTPHPVFTIRFPVRNETSSDN